MAFLLRMINKSHFPAISKVIGYVFTLIALVYFFKQAYLSLNEISTYTWSLEQLVVTLLSAGLILLIGLLSGIAWHVLLMNQGAKTNLRINMSVLCTSQIAKYIPGNIGQYFGRIYFSRKNGIPADAITVSMAIETLWLIFIATILTGITFLLFEAANTKSEFFEDIRFIHLLLISVLCFLGPLLVIRLLHLVAKVTNTNLFTRLKPFSASTSLKIWAIYLVIFFMHGLLVSIHILLFSEDSTTNILLNTVLYATVWLAGYIFPGAPAGLGVREAATFAIFTNFYDAPTCITISISLRLASIIGDMLTYAVGRQLKKP